MTPDNLSPDAPLRLRILVCGGRDFTDMEFVYRTLQPYHARCEVLIQGNSRGADLLALRWAIDRSVPYAGYPADWQKHGPRAGPIRNKRMLLEGKPNLVLAFPGGAGTANMVKLAHEAGVPVVEVGR